MHESISLLSTGIDASCYSSERTRSAVREHIVNEIVTMQAWVNKLMDRHNSLSIIARLPPELLAEIFKRLPSMYDADDWKRAPWVKVSFVSHYWRETALHCPELWSVLRAGIGEDYLSTYLPRSGALPLSIFPWGSKNLSMDGMNHVLGQMHRVRELNLGENWSDYNGVLRRSIIPRLTSPAPLLESLTLTPGGTARVVYLPENAFSGALPHLRTMFLRECMVPPTNLTPLPNLISLTLFELHYPQGPSLHQLLLMLKTAPNLEDLTLYKAFLTTGYDESDSEFQVHFPRLKSLEIYSTTIPEALALYVQIIHPTTSRVRIVPQPTDDAGRRNFEEHEEDTDSVQDFGINITDRIVARHFSVRILEDSHSLTLSESPEENEPTNSAGAISLELPRDREDGALIIPLLNGLDFNHLVSLSTEWIDVPPETWLFVFGTLPLLSTICIYLRGDSTLLRAIGYAIPVQMDGPRTSFPALHTLIFKGFDFTSTSLLCLEASLSARLAFNAKLPLLRIIQEGRWPPGVHAQTVVERVEHLVDHVERCGPPKPASPKITIREEEGYQDDAGIHVNDDSDSSDMGYGLFD